MSAVSVLLIDDEPALRAALAEALALEGFDVEDAGSVASAEAAFARRRFDAVVTDVRLPDGSGLDLLERLRALDPRFRAVVATGFGTYEHALQAIRCRVGAFLPKPFSFGDLLGALRSRDAAPAEAPVRAGAIAARADAAGQARLGRALDAELERLRVAPAVGRRARACAAEAVENAVLHAYPLDRGDVRLEVERRGERLAITVADRGCAFDVSSAIAGGLSRGAGASGLVRLHREADAVAVRSRSGRGTEVTLEFGGAFAPEPEAVPADDEALPVALLWS